MPHENYDMVLHEVRQMPGFSVSW